MLLALAFNCLMRQLRNWTPSPAKTSDRLSLLERFAVAAGVPPAINLSICVNRVNDMSSRRTATEAVRVIMGKPRGRKWEDMSQCVQRASFNLAVGNFGATGI